MKKIINIIIVILCFLSFINPIHAEELSNITSKNILLIDYDTNDIIYEKNIDDKELIASTTKIMTALVSIENIDNYEEKVVVTSEMLKDIEYDYSVVGFKTGDVVTYDDLLYGTLLRSGADATNILGYSIGGNIDDFVKLMNNKAEKLGMNNTHYTNTIGMDDNKNNYSTARDLSILLKYAFKNKKYKEVITTKEYVTTNSITLKGPLSKMHGKDLNMSYVLGGKTGFTEDAGLCLATVAKNNNHNYILVTLGATYENKSNHMIEQKQIYEYYFNNYDYKKILKKDKTIVKLKTVYDEEINIKSNEEITYFLPKDLKLKDLTYEYKGKKVLNKNVKKNDKVGTYYIKYNDKILYEKDIYSPKTVIITIDYFIKHNYIILIFASLIILLFPICMHKKRKSRKNKRR